MQILYFFMILSMAEYRRPQQESLWYRKGANKSLPLQGRKQATATEDFDVHISYL
jgi:hypothetical protein